MKIVTSHPKMFLVVCSFQWIAIFMPCISHSNRLGGPIVRTAWAIHAKKICIRSHWMVSHHLIASVQKFPSAVSRQPSAVYPFDCICAKIFFIHASVWLQPCKTFLHLYIHLAVPFWTAWLSISHQYSCHVFACHLFIPKERFCGRGHNLHKF